MSYYIVLLYTYTFKSSSEFLVLSLTHTTEHKHIRARICVYYFYCFYCLHLCTTLGKRREFEWIRLMFKLRSSERTYWNYDIFTRLHTLLKRDKDRIRVFSLRVFFFFFISSHKTHSSWLIVKLFRIHKILLYIWIIYITDI